MKVLIPVDGSDCSKATIDWAAQTIDKSSTEFYLFHVIPRNIPELVTEEYEVEDALSMLKELQARLEAKGCKVAKAEYAEGDPVKDICKYANEEKIDQVLMGTHGRTGLAKLLLGSVATGVMEHCDKPVFIHKNTAKSAVKA